MAARSNQARAVLDAVHRLDHPTADDVHAHVRRRLPRLSLATTYRNLGRLVDDGDIAVRQIGGQKRYDPNVAPHIHLHDTDTDRLVDLPMTPEVEAAIQAACAPYIDAQDCIIEVRGRLIQRPQQETST